MTQLRTRKVIVFGISADTVALHRDFARNEDLNFPLLADPTKETIKAYGVLGKDGLPRRVTFIIGPDGTIRSIDGNVDAEFERQGNTLISHHGENLALLFSEWRARVGSPVPFFYLPDADGHSASSLQPGSKASVLFLFDTKCQAARESLDALTALASNPVYKNISFMGISANAGEKGAELKAFAETYSVAFPLVTDPFHEVLDHLEAQQTPIAWVMDAKGTVIYRGAIIKTGADGKSVSYVKEALNALLSGRPVPVKETPVQGCPVP